MRLFTVQLQKSQTSQFSRFMESAFRRCFLLPHNPLLCKSRISKPYWPSQLVSTRLLAYTKIFTLYKPCLFFLSARLTITKKVVKSCPNFIVKAIQSGSRFSYEIPPSSSRRIREMEQSITHYLSLANRSQRLSTQPCGRLCSRAIVARFNTTIKLIGDVLFVVIHDAFLKLHIPILLYYSHAAIIFDNFCLYSLFSMASFSICFSFLKI